MGDISSPSNLSPSLNDLIHRFFIVNPAHRITIEQIIEHEWMKRSSTLDRSVLEDEDYVYKVPKLEEIDENVLEILVAKGLKEEDIKLSLLNGYRNRISTDYYLELLHYKKNNTTLNNVDDNVPVLFESN